MTDIRLAPEEEIVWRGKISRLMLTGKFILILLPVLLFSVYAFTQSTVGFSLCTSRYGNIPNCAAPNIYVNGFATCSVVLGVGLILLIVNFFLSCKEEYVVTSKRVIIKRWLFGTFYRSLYFANIRAVVNTPGWFGALGGWSTIKIDIGDRALRTPTVIMYVCLYGVLTPEEVYPYLRDAIQSVPHIDIIRPVSPLEQSMKTKNAARIQIAMFVVAMVLIAVPSVIVLGGQYWQDHMSHVQQEDQLKIEQGQALLTPLSMEKATKGVYPPTLQESSLIQTVQTSSGPIPFLNEFTYQSLENGNAFRLCIQLSTSEKCWTAADISK